MKEVISIEKSNLNLPVTVDMLIFTVENGHKLSYRKLPEKVLKVLMIKRRDNPFIGEWALPCGFVSADESLDEAALRKLKEEVNIDNIYMEQLYTWGDVKRYPERRVISCSYMSLVNSSSLNIKAGSDVEDAKWFTVRYSTIEEKKTIVEKGYKLQNLVKIEFESGDIKLSAVVKIVKTMQGDVVSFKREIKESQGLAFDHARIIQYGIERLRNKIEYTDIAFNLMPSYFSLTELQQVYEVILDRELLKANFRRKISNMVIETDRVTKDVGHRPSKLYKFNPDWMEDSF